VGDLHRRAEICEAANGRYLAALASVRAGESVGAVVRSVCRPVVKDGRRYRALNPWAEPDAALLEVLSRGEWAVSGVRNRDVRAALYPRKADAAEQRRQSGRVTRALARLRAHGMIRKVGGTHRYHLTQSGRQIILAVLTARHANVDKLMALAALRSCRICTTFHHSIIGVRSGRHEVFSRRTGG